MMLAEDADTQKKLNVIKRKLTDAPKSDLTLRIKLVSVASDLYTRLGKLNSAEQCRKIAMSLRMKLKQPVVDCKDKKQLIYLEDGTGKKRTLYVDDGTTLVSLPLELKIIIFAKLSIVSVTRLQKTCKSLNNIIQR